MRPSRRHCLFASLVLAVFLLAAPTHAETLTVTSTPPGATVEIDGVEAGTTPYTTDFPGGYFHKTHTAFGSRLEHSMTLRVSKEGYLSQQMTVTNGPFEWVAVTGRHRGNYFLLKANHFDIHLDPLSHGSAGPVETIGTDGPLRPAAVLAFHSEEHDAHSAFGIVTIATEPPDAEIYIDGKFVGQTPSTIQLSAASHHIEVKSSGKQTWQRDLEVLKDSQITLHPVLESSP